MKNASIEQLSSNKILVSNRSREKYPYWNKIVDLEIFRIRPFHFRKSATKVLNQGLNQLKEILN
ncbi:hypothetical protein BpHYR1_041496 [Brachionus plicatilis]|uniref:Uncharacterized protein n=1 Tax=Brachionus plicatilis TaxID=10195 RepID=A0A3M7S6X9_BRAPC|nr:hypothetical protein BpHYR1_041496 [Brachionus plicatilis]